jgi:hypothetical protein
VCPGNIEWGFLAQCLSRLDPIGFASGIWSNCRLAWFSFFPCISWKENSLYVEHIIWILFCAFLV